MFGMRSKTQFDSKSVLRKVHEGTVRSLGHAAALVRKIAKQSIRFRKDPQKASPEGTPPYTHTRQLPRAILFAVQKQQEEAVIGPDAGKVDLAGAAHEHGGQFRGQYFVRRPFMGPALEKTKSRLPKMWAGSVR